MDILKLSEDIQEESKQITDLINTLTQAQTCMLDNHIENIEKTLLAVAEGTIKEYPLNKLELDFALLTTEIYKLNNLLVDLAASNDIAKSKKEVAFSQAYLKNNGNTIKEKEALATIATDTEALIEKIYNRVSKHIQNKLDRADSVHMALKRMHSARLTEIEVFRGEQLKGGRQ